MHTLLAPKHLPPNSYSVDRSSFASWPRTLMMLPLQPPITTFLGLLVLSLMMMWSTPSSFARSPTHLNYGSLKQITEATSSGEHWNVFLGTLHHLLLANHLLLHSLVAHTWRLSHINGETITMFRTLSLEVVLPNVKNFIAIFYLNLPGRKPTLNSQHQSSPIITPFYEPVGVVQHFDILKEIRHRVSLCLRPPLHPTNRQLLLLPLHRRLCNRRHLPLTRTDDNFGKKVADTCIGL